MVETSLEIQDKYDHDPVFRVVSSDYMILGWYFYDETWAWECGPYATEWQCRGELARYIVEQLK